MSKFTFILGLAGSGKSYRAKQMKQKDNNLFVIDDAFHPYFNADTFEENLKRLDEAVSAGYNAVIIEGAFCYKDFRERMVNFLKSRFPSVEFEWICFENDISKANKNLYNPDRKHRDPKQHEDINSSLSPNYTYPDNCKIVPIFEEP